MKSCRSDDHEDQEVLMESCGEVAEEKQTISRRAKCMSEYLPVQPLYCFLLCSHPKGQP